MATCIRCGSDKLTEWPCPKCGGLENGANAEMVEGYRDGLDLNSPEPSQNRSRSYQHGFLNGRADRTGKLRPYTCDEIRRMGDEAMATDAEISLGG